MIFSSVFFWKFHGFNFYSWACDQIKFCVRREIKISVHSRPRLPYDSYSIKRPFWAIKLPWHLRWNWHGCVQVATPWRFLLRSVHLRRSHGPLPPASQQVCRVRVSKLSSCSFTSCFDSLNFIYILKGVHHCPLKGFGEHWTERTYHLGDSGHIKDRMQLVIYFIPLESIFSNAL